MALGLDKWRWLKQASLGRNDFCETAGMIEPVANLVIVGQTSATPIRRMCVASSTSPRYCRERYNPMRKPNRKLQIHSAVGSRGLTSAHRFSRQNVELSPLIFLRSF